MFVNGSASSIETQHIFVNGSEFMTNFTERDTSERNQRDSLYVIVPITLFYVIIFITGVVGNVSTCIVIFFNKYMHTATNYYLFSLAISDLLLLCSALPKEIYELWFGYTYIFGEVTCFLQGFASESAANATVLTITAFTFERYVAICHPFMSHTVSKLSRAVKYIITIWIFALGLAIPQALPFGLRTTDQGIQCTITDGIMEYTFEISSLVFFVIPTFVITVLYVLIGFRLRNSRVMRRISPSNAGIVEPRQANRNQTRVIRMLAAVVAAFVICWAPFHAQRLLAIYGLKEKNVQTGPVIEFYNVLTYVSGILYYLSATINPILYNIMSHRFRRAFKLTFGHMCGCCLSKQKRNKYIIRTRACHTCRLNHHFQLSTPRSSLSHKEQMFHLENNTRMNEGTKLATKTNNVERNGGAIKVDHHVLETRVNDLLKPETSIFIENGKCTTSLKKERSPIIAIRNKLNALRPLTSLSVSPSPSSPRQTKSTRHSYCSTEKLSETTKLSAE